MQSRFNRAIFVAHYLKGNTMKKVLLFLITYFAMVSFAYADPKPTENPIDAANVTAAVDEKTTEASKSKNDHDKHDKKDKKDKKHKKDHAEESGGDHDKNKDAKDADEEEHHDKKEKKSHKEHKHD
jgi:hypothetical protein